ncbi:MAG: glycosyltransferase, partial [Proteobacteria bacterium]
SPIIAVMDADGQHDEQALPKLVELLRGGEYDLAVGSRFAPGATITGFPEERLKLSLRANSLTQKYFGVKVLDSNTGYFAIRREAFEGVVRSLSGRGFKILLDILLADPNLRTIEIPINFRSRLEGESKLSKYVLAEYAIQLYEAKIGKLLPPRVALDLGLVAVFSLLAALVANGLYQFLHVPAATTEQKAQAHEQPK